MSAFDAVFVGVATHDALALVERFPGPDERVLADEVTYAGGGPAATAAVAAARLGVRAAFVGTVGDDANGRSVLAGLTAEGVDVSGVCISSQHPTAASVVIVDRVRGTRAICNRPAPQVVLTSGARLVREAPIVHVDQAGWAPVRDLGLPQGQLLSVDGGNEIPGFSAQGVGLYAPTVEALRRSYGGLVVEDLLAAAISDGCATVVATDGSRGSYARTADGMTAFAPAVPVEVVSTLGAGDVFHGALVAAVVRGLPLVQQLGFANRVAALSCRGLDGRSRIPVLSEVLDHLPAPTP
ncbi:MAG: PfkB family carbohydrate kinase [Lapillicoccus sp.]